jgi:hypothetical protein
MGLQKRMRYNRVHARMHMQGILLHFNNIMRKLLSLLILDEIGRVHTNYSLVIYLKW